MAADGSKNHTPDGGQGPGPGGTTSSVRLRAEEVVERGLRLYAHGDLVGALAEWRRALEMDHGNRRGRDYVAYVEGHFDVLSEKFRSARERLGSAIEPLDLAIEIEADDPMEDMEPYESIELDRAALPGQTSGQAPGDEDDSDETGERTVPAPGAPHLRGEAAGGKLGAGRRPWGRRPGRVPMEYEDAPWPPHDDWPQSARNDTLEMAVDPSLLEELEGLGVALADGPLGGPAGRAIAPPPGGPGEGAPAADAADVAAGDAADGGADAAPTDEPTTKRCRVEEEPGSATIDDVLDAEEEEDSQAGEVTVPARPPHSPPQVPPSGSTRGRPAGPPKGPPSDDARGLPAGPQKVPTRERAPVRMTAEGSGPLDDRVAPPVPPQGPASESARGLPAGPPKGPPSESARGLPAGPPWGPALGSGRAMVNQSVRAADADAWADGTPPAEPEAEEPPDLPDLDDGALVVLPPEKLQEVRVTFRRSTRTSAPPIDGSEEAIELEPDRPGSQRSRADDDRIDLDDYGPEDSDDDQVDEEELTIERYGVSARASQAVRRDRERETAPLPGRNPSDTDADRATTELQAQPRPMSHSAIAIDLVSADLIAELDVAMSTAPATGDETLRSRVAWLIARARSENQAGRFPTAVLAIDLALEENPESAVAQKLIHSHRDLLYEIYGNYLGDMRAVPALALPMSAIPLSELDHRSAFLLSRVDGVLSLEDVLDVSGMARLEAFRHLSRLMLRGILEIRP